MMYDLKKLEEKIEEIRAAGSEVYIVNAGRMNHGKSSLFNSLLDKEYFATGDIRTTVISNKVEFADNIYFVDTPGLDAEKKDDKEAFEAYKKASMIIFVHTLNVGELHKDELDRIIQIEKLFPSTDYFWNHFCLALTFSEAVDSESIDLIKDKILSDIKNKCGEVEFPVFLISNSRYTKGRKEGKNSFIAKSGIEELKAFLNKNIIKWQSEVVQLNNERVEDIIQKEIEKLKSKKVSCQKAYNTKANKAESSIIRLDNILVQACEGLSDEILLKDRKMATLKRYENELGKLKSRHESERY